MVRTATVIGSDKSQVGPPMDNFKKLHEETCLNHAYPFKHKLMDNGMMKNFMASGPSLRHGSR
jgi:hypothetical protein